jgi:hypothetical protein
MLWWGCRDGDLLALDETLLVGQEEHGRRRGKGQSTFSPMEEYSAM